MKDQLNKRFWVFVSPEHDCSLGMNDFVGGRSTLDAAIRLAENSPGFEWASVFDSATGKQYDYLGCFWGKPNKL